MTTVEQLTAPGGETRRPASGTVTVFGVDWPAYKAHAVLVGVVAVALVLAFGGTGSLAGWVAATAVVLVWWGERLALGLRWDDRERDHHARR
ncbi:hypothetical protein ACFQNE_06830 [Gordonia phosphorivorans]|uniref:UsfY protein n=1 Tax=Gordonia phosphorivorans TaxID=1056982 RepID=A0ABV6H4H6_9ACTN